MRNFKRHVDAKRLLRAATLVFLLCGTVFVPAAGAQRRSARVRAAGGEQTAFNAEEHVRRPVPIPQDVLRGLGQDEKVLTCLKLESGGATVEIPAAWFAASAIDLNRDAFPDLIVKPENECLFGANIAPFWVFRNTGRGYALALRTDTIQLEILPTRTRGYRNISTSAPIARRVYTRVYKFDGHSYRPARR